MYSPTSWFTGSVAVDHTGRPQPFFHGSITKFTAFDKSKIRANESDAPYNGFWFTSNRSDASPAWKNPTFIFTCYLQLRNPAPHKVIREVNKFVSTNIDSPRYSTCRSSADALRFELQFNGYDGVIHEDSPLINVREFMSTGKTSYRTVRGSLYYLEVDNEYGGVDLFDSRHDHITGYLNLEDFVSLNSERIFVVFEPYQINVINIEPCKW